MFFLSCCFKLFSANNTWELFGFFTYHLLLFFFFDKKLFFSFSFKKKIQNIHLQRNKSKVEEQFEVSVHLITTSYSKHNLYLIF